MNRNSFDAPFAEPVPSPFRHRYPVKDCPHPRAFLEKPIHREKKGLFEMRNNLMYAAVIVLIVYAFLYLISKKSM